MNIQGKTEFHRRLIGAGLAALICCSALAGAAGAGTEPTRRSVTVSYGDLNLANPAGVERLYQRLRQAANQVCDNLKVYSLAAHSAPSYRKCTKQAVEEAVASINNRSLTALHQQRSSRRYG